VHAVGLADLDVDESGALERGLVLASRERAGNAPGVRRHVGPSRLVHVLVGDDVGDRDAAARS